MIFIGSGSLLRYALVQARDASINIDLICSNRDDGLVGFCQRLKFPTLITESVNEDLLREIGRSTDGLAFSVNNSIVLNDDLLESGIAFFNIHNGLTQKYRGIAEVCILSSICKSESEYGSTLHRILPGQEIDAGPVLNQMSFSVNEFESFETVFSNSIDNYKKHIESTLQYLPLLNESESIYLHGSEIFSYRNVPTIIRDTPYDRRVLACDLGKYSGLLEQLSVQIKNSHAL